MVQAGVVIRWRRHARSCVASRWESGTFWGPKCSKAAGQTARGMKSARSCVWLAVSLVFRHAACAESADANQSVIERQRQALSSEMLDMRFRQRFPHTKHDGAAMPDLSDITILTSPTGTFDTNEDGIVTAEEVTAVKTKWAAAVNPRASALRCRCRLPCLPCALGLR